MAVESRRIGDPRLFLRTAAIAFALGFSVHALDHARRGLGVLPTRVVVVGTIQGLLVALAVWMTMSRRPRAPIAAALVGFGSALLFTSGHLLPSSPDSYVEGPVNVIWFSWLSAFAEIGTGILFGIAGVRALVDRASSSPRPARDEA